MLLLELTQDKGGALDIPAASILFLETIDADGKKANPRSRCGIFYSLGEVDDEKGTPIVRGAVVQQPFPKLAKKIQEATPAPMLELTRSDGGRVLLGAHNVVGLRALGEDHPPPGGNCQITHRVGARVLLLDVLETRDEIKAKLPAPPKPARATGAKPDGDAAENGAGSQSNARGPAKVRPGRGTRGARGRA